jgi:hypothetical protein
MYLQLIALFMTACGFFILGALALYALEVYRIWSSDDSNDDSNINNPARALNHFIIHAKDFQHAYYLSPEEVAAIEQELGIKLGGRRPFWYMDKDEYSQVVKTRPKF